MNVFRVTNRSAWSLATVISVIVIVGALALVAVSCAKRSPVTLALAKAQAAADKVNLDSARLQLLTDVGVAWMKHDPRRGKAILDDVITTAAKETVAGNDARGYALSRSAIALACADPKNATSILLRAIGELHGIDRRSYHLYRLIAALAWPDPKKALYAAQVMPPGDREIALAYIALAMAQRDPKRSAQLLKDALRDGSPPARFADEWWYAVGADAARDHPREAARLARDKIRTRSRQVYVVTAAVSSLAEKDWPAAERMVAQQQDSEARLWGWIVLAHKSRGERKATAIERAVEMLSRNPPPRSELDRFDTMCQWCLLAGLAGDGSAAKKYLGAAEAAWAKPPSDVDLGLVMATACYVDPAKAMNAYRQLMERGRMKRRSDREWGVLEDASHLIALVDVKAAQRAVIEAPRSRRIYYDSSAARLADLARRTLSVASRVRAENIMAAAEKAFDQEERAGAFRAPGDPREWRREQRRKASLEAVALGLARFGKTSKAMRIIGGMRDPRESSLAYLHMARMLEEKPGQPMDAFASIRLASKWLYQEIAGRPAYRPWKPAQPPRDGWYSE